MVNFASIAPILLELSIAIRLTHSRCFWHVLIFGICVSLFFKAAPARPVASGSDAAESSDSGSSSPSSSVGRPPSPVSTTDEELLRPTRRRLQIILAVQEHRVITPDRHIASSHAGWLVDYFDLPLGTINIHPVSIGPGSELETEALLLAQNEDTKIEKMGSRGRSRIVPGSAKTYARFHLMVPTPVNERWYRLLNIPWTAEAASHQPFLFYDFHTRARTENDFLKFVGVGIATEPLGHHDELMRIWHESVPLESLKDIRLKTAWSELYRKLRAP